MKTRKVALIVAALSFVLSAAVFAGGQKESSASVLAGHRVNLSGKTIHMTILGIGGWLPSKLGVDMAPAFAKYAKQKYGYTADFSYQEAPFSSLYQKAATSLATKSQEFNIIISDSQWLGAFARAGWIVKLNNVIQDNPALKKIRWFNPVVKWSYMTYPYKSDNLWGMPEEGDVLVLYVRNDLMKIPANQQAFKAEFGFDLPTTYSAWADITFSQYEKIAQFFTQPSKNLYGVAIQYSKEYDFMTGSLYPFMWSMGGHIWNPKTRNVYGILNSGINAKALKTMVGLQKYAPPGVQTYGIGQVLDAFTQGKVATAWQWAAEGVAMFAPQLKGKVLAVPTPIFVENGVRRRISSLGGQPWVVNAFNDPEHMQVALDFLGWWYKKSTQMEFARKGGNPYIKSVVDQADFAQMHPWFRAYKDMLTTKHAYDFWHVPQYAQMLSTQQVAFTAYATGEVTNAQHVLDYVACKQQKILHDGGVTKEAPPASCQGITLQ